MNEALRLNPTNLSNEALDRIAFAVAERIPSAMDLLTKEEAAKYLRVSYKTFERRLSSGHYPEKIIHWDGGTMLFSKRQLFNYIESL